MSLLVLVGERGARIPRFACLSAALLMQCYWCCCGWRPIWREREGGREHKRGLVGNRASNSKREREGELKRKLERWQHVKRSRLGLAAWARHGIELAKCGLVLGETKPRQALQHGERVVLSSDYRHLAADKKQTLKAKRKKTDGQRNEKNAVSSARL
ncbi:hypothetical protein GGI42DRAFT_247077 [Trichoderma sp. SZMC 28013]